LSSRKIAGRRSAEPQPIDAEASPTVS
jgi:hypothetical protein